MNLYEYPQFSDKALYPPLFPTPGAPITATFTSHSELFFLRIPLIAFDVILRAFVTAQSVTKPCSA